MEVTHLYRYVIAGCQPTEVQSSFVDEHGMVGDRSFIITPQSENGRSYQSKTPGLARIKPEVHTAQGILRLSVPADPQLGSVDISFEDFRGASETVLISKRSGKETRAQRLRGSEYAREWLSDTLGEHHDFMRLTEGNGGFHDGMHLTTEISRHKTNEALQKPASMSRFRPNVVIDGEEPFAEKAWRNIQIGTESYRHAGDTIRCQYVNIDQRTGKHTGDETLLNISRHHRSLFGIMIALQSANPGPPQIMVGDRLEVH